MPRELSDASLCKQAEKNSGRAMTNNTCIPHARKHRRNAVRWIGHTSSFLEQQLSEIVSYRIFRIVREIQFARGCLCLRLAWRLVPKGVVIDLSTFGLSLTHNTHTHTHTHLRINLA